MKYKTSLFLKIISSFLLVLGTLGFFFPRTAFAGYLLFVLGCSFGLISVALHYKFDVYERFHLLTSLMGFGIVGLFILSGIKERVVIISLMLFIINLFIVLLNIPSRKKEDDVSEPDVKYDKYNEKEIYNELDDLKDEVAQIQILEEGEISDMKDLSAKAQAEQIKKEFSQAIIVEDPKDGRYFFKDTGKMFHLRGCTAIKNVRKKDLKSSNSRTELLARGYKPCKICKA
jgi:hypothetical protein